MSLISQSTLLITIVLLTTLGEIVRSFYLEIEENCYVMWFTFFQTRGFPQPSDAVNFNLRRVKVSFFFSFSILYKQIYNKVFPLNVLIFLQIIRQSFYKLSLTTSK